MKVNYVLKDEYINSFSIIPFDKNKPNINIVDGDEELLMTGKCKVINNQLDTSEAKIYLEEEAKKLKLITELKEAQNWMYGYDLQLMLYTRQMHLANHSDIDIEKLDLEAKAKLNRIKELKTLLK